MPGIIAAALLLVAGPALAQDKDLTDTKRVFVPVEELDTILNRDKKGVILPKAEFEQLVAKAKRDDGAPAKLLISQIDYVAEIKDSQLILNTQVRFEQFTPGWHSLQLQTGGLSIESAKLGDKQPPLGRKGTGTAYLLNNKTGEHTLELTMSAPLANVGSDLVASFQLLPCPSATFNITIPAGKQLAVDGSLMERTADNAEPATLTFPVGGNRKIELRVTERQRSQKSDALVFMSSAYGVNVAPSEITWQAVTTLQSFGESLDKFTFTVPRTLEIAAVDSTGLEAWELADNADQTATEITLTYRQPIDGSRRITFRGVMAVPVNQQWALPGLRLNNAASEIGRVVVQHPVGTRLVIETMDGIRRAADAKTNSKLSQASFDIWQPDFDLQLRLQLREREVLANMSTVLDVEENTVRFETLAGIECLNSPLFEVLTSVPVDWEPTSITLNGSTVKWSKVPREAGRQYLKIPFPTPLPPGGEFKLKINAVQNLTPDDAGKSSFEIPEVAIEDAGVVEGLLLIRSANWLRTTPEELTGLDTAVLPNMKSEHPAFRYQDKNYSGTIKVEPRATRLTAWTQTFTRLDPERAVTWLDLHLDVQGGGLRELAVKLPESVGERLRFAITQNCAPAVRIREQIAQEVADGQRTWMLRFDRRVRGSITLGGFMEEDRADAGNAVPEAIIEAADRQYGFITVEASAEQHLILDVGNAELQNVDPVDLPRSSYKPKERIVAAYRYVRPGFIVTATEERFDRKAVPTAVCDSLAMHTVVSKTGQLRHQAVMNFVAVGVQNLRMSLPEGANLWSTEIDGEPVEVRRDGETYLVPLKRAATPDAVRCLQLTYESKTDTLSVIGNFQHSAPGFRVDVAGSDQPIETLSRTWNILHSANTVFDQSNGVFEPTAELGEQGLLARIPNLLTLPTQQTAGDKALAVGAILLLVLVPTLCYRRWGASGVVGMLAVGGPLLLIAAMLLQSSTYNSRMVTSAMAPEAVELSAATQMRSAADEETPNSPTVQSNSGRGVIQDNSIQSDGNIDFDFNVQGNTISGEDLDFGEDTNGNGFTNESAPAFGSRQLTFPGGNGRTAGPIGGQVQSSEPTPAAPSAATGARLSVPIDFQVPDSYITTSFAYQGTNTANQQPDLDINYHGRELNTIAPIAIALFVLLWFWFSRRSGVGFRVFLVACGLLLPLALAPLVPSLWQIALEGIFFGTLAGIALWVLAGVIERIKRLPISRRELNAAAVLLMLLAPTAAAQTQTSDGPPRIVVPYDENGQPLAADRVFLPHATFLKLWQQANPDKAFANAPMDGLVSSANYAAKLVRDGDSAHMQIKARFVLHNFRDQQISVRLPLGQVAVETAELNGETAPLRVEMIKDTNRNADKFDGANGPAKQQIQQKAAPQPNLKPALSVVLEKSGDSVLDIDFVVPVKLTGPAGRFQLPLEPMASALMSFQLPDKDLQVRVNGSSTAWRTGEGDDLQFPVSAGGNVTIEWQPKDEDSGVDRVIHTESTTTVIMDDAGLQVKAELAYRIRQGSASELAFRIPATAILQQVTGTDVGGWQQDENDGVRTVRVFLRRSVEEETAITVQLFANPDITDKPTIISVPNVEPVEVTREVGQLGIFAESGIVVRADTARGATQIDPGTFPARHNSRPAVLAWRHRVRPFEVTVSAVRPQARLKANANHAVFVERRKLRYTSRFNLQPQGAPRARVAVVLPQDFLPLEVYATNIADWYPYKDESGTDLLIVDLATPTLQAVELVVTGTIARQPDADIASIPAPRMNEATEATSQIAIRIDESYTSSIANSGDWKSVAPELLDQDVQKLSKANIRFAFQTDNLQPEPIAVRLTTMPATLFGESVSVISLTDTSVEYSLNLKWIVRQSATDRFAFSGPDWLAGKLEVRGNGLRQVIESEPADGRVIWTLVLQEPRSTEYFALGTATFPPTANANLQSPMLQCEPGTTEDNPIQVQNHYAVVINQSERLITPVDASLKTVEPAELQIKIPQKYLDRATQIVAVPKTAPPQWIVTTPERREGAPATVNLADLKTVVASDGSFRTKATYTLRNRTRQFLPLVLPDDTTLLSVFVKGKPARPVVTDRGGKQLHLIALPRTSEADLSFGVEIVVSGSIPNVGTGSGLNLAGSEVSLPVPEVLSQRDDEEFGIPVAMTVWKVHVPDSWHADMVTGSSNVTRQDESGSDVIRVMSSLKEAVEQSFAFSGSSVRSNRGEVLNKQATAYDNLKQAEKRFVTDNSGSMQNKEVAKELQQLQRNISDLKKQLADQGVTFNADASKANIDQNLQIIDGGQSYIVDFNDSLITGNSIQGFTGSEQFRADNFKLNLKGKEGNDKQGYADSGAKDKFNSLGRNRSGTKSFQNLNSQVYSVDVPQARQRGLFDEETQPATPMFDPFSVGGDQQGQAGSAEPQSGAGVRSGNSFFGGGGGGGGAGGLGGGLNNQPNFSNVPQQSAVPPPLVGFGTPPTQKPATRSMNLQGDVVLQPLDDLGAVVINGQQADIDIVTGIIQELEAAEAQTPTEWTQTGGLSLPINVASDATPMNFSKVGGTPQLTLRIRPADTMRKGYGLVWAIAWIGIALAAFAAYRKAGTTGLWQFVPMAMTLAGLLGFVLLKGPNATAAFILFAIGVALVALASTKASAQTT
jgi:hypothetical protein